MHLCHSSYKMIDDDLVERGKKQKQESKKEFLDHNFSGGVSQIGIKA